MMSLNLSSILVALCLGSGSVFPLLPVWSLPVNAIEIAQSTSTPTTAEDFYNRGVEKGEKEDFQGAIADVDQALRLNPKYYVSICEFYMVIFRKYNPKDVE